MELFICFIIAFLVLFAVVVFAIKTAAEDIVIDFKKNLIDDLKKPNHDDKE